MIEVRIASVNADATSGQPVLLLKPLEHEVDGQDARLLPIWIGQPEASAIMLGLQGIDLPRPMTHDLLRGLIDQLGYVVLRVEVTRLEGGTYFAAIIVRGEERVLAIDARPSDAVALAVRIPCAIFVAEDVWEAAAVTVRAVDDAEEELERFREFLDHVDPSDFTS
ncbi:MAG: hypothetical protein CVT59_02560 [Actinobacteria bacterium HGW-Actinobacteria-1]|jgi:hypothetical protein|nr:MAG: hypothetical protein CVT59_02560 [Actinobacteria bacterium HGW-Actinobacteria-1]